MRWWAVAGCLAAVGATGAVCWSLAYARGVGAAEKVATPTRVFIERPAKDGDSERRINDLINALDEANEKVAAMEEQKEAGVAGRERDFELCSMAERAVAESYAHMTRPEWLRGEYRLHKSGKGYIVEGMVLESRDERPPYCYLWGVEIVPNELEADHHLYPRQMVFDRHLNVYSSDSGKWMDVGVINIPEGTPYPRWDYGKGFPTRRDLVRPASEPERPAPRRVRPQPSSLAPRPATSGRSRSGRSGR